MQSSKRVPAEPAPPYDDLILRTMRVGDLDEVLSIERRSFASPWKREHFLHEMQDNRWARTRVAERAGCIVGYASVWIIDRELKINNIAVHPQLRRRRVGRWLLLAILHEALLEGCRLATLEVRPSNRPARRLYRAHGFVAVGRRQNYYAAEREDAIVMSLNLLPSRWPEIASGRAGGV